MEFCEFEEKPDDHLKEIKFLIVLSWMQRILDKWKFNFFTSVDEGIGESDGFKCDEWLLCQE